MSIKNHFKNKLLAGILIVTPLGITFFVLSFLFTTIDGWFAPIMKGVLGERYYQIGMGVLATILFVYLVGLIVSNIVGRKLVGVGDWVLTKIPLIREVYGPVKQLVQMILPSSGHNNFRKVVIIKPTGSSIRVIGFVTGEVREEGNPVPLLSVFVPKTPNPTTGFVLFCDPETVYETNMKTETALKVIVSGGLVAPGNFTIHQGFQQENKIDPKRNLTE